jgi:hypothetical protein
MNLPGRVYHLAEASNWPVIQREGLLCASDLLLLAGLNERERDRLDRQQRSTQAVLPNGVRIRDQPPARDDPRS